VDDLEHRQLVSMAMNGLILEFRKILQQTGKYIDTKLALMDMYKVKMTSLATGPIYCQCWKLPSLPKKSLKKPRVMEKHPSAIVVVPVVLDAPIALPQHCHGADLTYGAALSRSPRHRTKK
jgi:hypothetical protein